jgi:hypothetical protein
MDSSEAFDSLAVEVSQDLDLVRRILAEHPGEGTSCRACRVPPGRPPIPAKCGPRSLALAALKVRVLTETRDAVAADELLVVDFIACGGIPDDDDLSALLGAWRDECHR